MVGRKLTFALSVMFLLLFMLNLSSAVLLANYTNQTGSVQRASNNLLNFSIGAVSENVTQVQFIITGSTVGDPDKFVFGTNSSSASGTFFVNSTSAAGGNFWNSFTTVITFSNISAQGIIPNGTSKYFWFNVSSKRMATSSMSVLVNVSGAGGVNSTVYSLPFSFSFSGYVKNETGGFQNATNVSMWLFQEGQNGPPTETLVTQTQTDANGLFTLSGISAAGGKMYKLKLTYYNQSNPTQALKVGTILPQFPAEMFYPQVQEEESLFNFMRPPSLNGTTFYLGPAATINISATNGSDVQRFGYMLMEQGTGFMIESNAMGNVTNAQLVVPVGRTYTLMLIRANSQFVQRSVCNGNFMNDSSCMSSPKSNSTISPTGDGQIVNVNMNLGVSKVQMYGCIGVSGNSTAITNISLILPKMLPWSGFVPPMQPDVQSLNLSNKLQLNTSDSRCPGKIAWYNISLLSANYLTEFYGRNNLPNISGEFLGAFQNVSFDGQSGGTNNYINITLGTLAGSFKEASSSELITGTGTNTTKFVVRIQNSTGGAITQDRPHVEFLVRNSVFGELNYIVEEMSNGTFYLALPLAGSTAKVKVFSNNAPPKEKTVNLTTGELNITLISMADGNSGFRKINSSGQLENMNITNSSFGMNMNFIRVGGSCDVLNPPANCMLTNMSATSFNPFSAMVAGKVNMQMILASGVGITFYNFDMFAAKQPPMESVMDNQAISGSGSAAQTWQFGSFVPADVYDYAIVSIPYSDSEINDSASVNISIPFLYDENWNVVWNSTRGDTGSNLTTSIDDYLGNSNNRSFNSTGYRNFIRTGGVLCNSTNNSITGSNPAVYCHINTSANVIYMRVPHFSGVAPSISGTAPASGTGGSTTTTTNTGSSGGSGSTPFWGNSYVITDEQFNLGYSKELSVKNRIKFKFANEDHHVGLLSLTSSNALIEIASNPVNITLSAGNEVKSDLNSDGYYDVYVRLLGVSNGKANLEIRKINEKVPTGGSSVFTTGEISSEIENDEQTNGINNEGVETNQRNYLFWTGAIVLIFIVVLVVFGIHKNRRHKRYMLYGF